MPSEEKKHTGDQFILIYPKNVSTSEIIKVVACQVKTRRSEMKYFIIASDRCIFKTSSSILFYGESFFIVEKEKPVINGIKYKDKGLFDEIQNLMKYDPEFKIEIDDYNQEPNDIIRDEDGGHMFVKMKRDPTFDAKKSTRFGRGHRRVTPIIEFKKIVGYKFIAFNEYTSEWANDIHGYDSFEDALKDIYPYQSKEIKLLRDLYLTRPRKMFVSTMIPTEWQEHLIHILDLPPKYNEQERTFYWFADFIGSVGKSMLTNHILSTRDDTLVISISGKTSDLIYSIKDVLLTSSKIKNILLDIPREMPSDKVKDSILNFFGEKHVEEETLKFMESCVNGRFSSTKYECLNFVTEHGLKIIVLSNSLPLLPAASLDRWNINLINDFKILRIKNLRCHEYIPYIRTREQTQDFYLSHPEIKSYMIEHGMSVEKKIPEWKKNPSKIIDGI